MIYKIIDNVNDTSKKFFIPPIPKPSERSMEIGSGINKAVGAALIGYGLMSKHKWLSAFGVASIITNDLISKSSKKSK